MLFNCSRSAMGLLPGLIQLRCHGNMNVIQLLFVQHCCAGGNQTPHLWSLRGTRQPCKQVLPSSAAPWAQVSLAA